MAHAVAPIGAAHLARGRTGSGVAAGRGGIGLVHVNDGGDPAGFKPDRHACIDAATIGRDTFSTFFTSVATRGVALIVESADTPRGRHRHAQGPARWG